MIDSTAKELVHWVELRRQDVEHARKAIQYVKALRDMPNAVPMLTTPRARAESLKMIHSAIECVRICDRQIIKAVEVLSLCDTHTRSYDCDCVAPF